MTAVDPALNGDVSLGLKLEAALMGIRAVVVLQRSFDIDRVRIVPLDQVAVVAIHGTHQIGERSDNPLGQAAA